MHTLLFAVTYKGTLLVIYASPGVLSVFVLRNRPATNLNEEAGALATAQVLVSLQTLLPTVAGRAKT